MTEWYPERTPSAGELADMVQLSKQDTEKLNDPRPLYAAAVLARRQAVDRGDPRAIEEAEARLSDIEATYPEVRTIESK